ncbi:hypothetical protein Tco_1370117, partial [Tanacetum coccineum]
YKWLEENIESVIGINKDDIDEEDDESSTMEPLRETKAIKAAIHIENLIDGIGKLASRFSREDESNELPSEKFLNRDILSIELSRKHKEADIIKAPRRSKRKYPSAIESPAPLSSISQEQIH